eukprot:4045421-Alexandrium_andersonii.AAC.1
MSVLPLPRGCPPAEHPGRVSCSLAAPQGTGVGQLADHRLAQSLRTCLRMLASACACVIRGAPCHLCPRTVRPRASR